MPLSTRDSRTYWRSAGRHEWACAENARWPLAWRGQPESAKAAIPAAAWQRKKPRRSGRLGATAFAIPSVTHGSSKPCLQLIGRACRVMMCKRTGSVRLKFCPTRNHWHWHAALSHRHAESSSSSESEGGRRQWSGRGCYKLGLYVGLGGSWGRTRIIPYELRVPLALRAAPVPGFGPGRGNEGGPQLVARGHGARSWLRA